jgi:hypothetical protein
MDEFRNRDAVYFIYQYEKGLTLADAGKKSMKARKNLMEWGKKNKIEYEYINQLAAKKILSDIQSHDFCDYKSVGNSKIPSRGSNPIKHPLPDKSEGLRYIYPISPVDHLSDDDLAKLLVQINSRAVNNFFQELRRRVLILERPLLSSRGNGMSYIYSNYNPKYAQQIVTIFRTFYNFVWTKKYGSKKLTPAQKMGLVDKKFEFRDIVYFR